MLFTSYFKVTQLHCTLKKCWVVLTQLWVKYGQTQPLGKIFNDIFNPMFGFVHIWPKVELKQLNFGSNMGQVKFGSSYLHLKNVGVICLTKLLGYTYWINMLGYF